MSEQLPKPPKLQGFVNVLVSDAERDRILAQEMRWSAPKLVLLGLVVLGLAFVLLYALASAPV